MLLDDAGGNMHGVYPRCLIYAHMDGVNKSKSGVMCVISFSYVFRICCVHADAARTADMLDILFHKDQLSDDEAEASDKWSLQGDTPSHSPMHSPERVPQESLARSNMPQPSAVMATQGKTCIGGQTCDRALGRLIEPWMLSGPLVRGYAWASVMQQGCCVWCIRADATLGGDDWQSEPEANDNWSLQGDSPMHSPERVPQESLANNSMDRRSAATRAQGTIFYGRIALCAAAIAC